MGSFCATQVARRTRLAARRALLTPTVARPPFGRTALGRAPFGRATLAGSAAAPAPTASSGPAALFAFYPTFGGWCGTRGKLVVQILEFAEYVVQFFRRRRQVFVDRLAAGCRPAPGWSLHSSLGPPSLITAGTFAATFVARAFAARAFIAPVPAASAAPAAPPAATFFGRLLTTRGATRVTNIVLLTPVRNGLDAQLLIQ
jgi:hypothetical protein